MKKTAAIFLGLAMGLALSYKPWMELRQTNAKLAEQRSELHGLQKDRLHWIRENARVSSRQGLREVLRENGYHEPGEVPLRDIMTQ